MKQRLFILLCIVPCMRAIREGLVARDGLILNGECSSNQRVCCLEYHMRSNRSSFLVPGHRRYVVFRKITRQLLPIA